MAQNENDLSYNKRNYSACAINSSDNRDFTIIRLYNFHYKYLHSKILYFKIFSRKLLNKIRMPPKAFTTIVFT